MRHSAICRRDEAAPHLFRTVEHAGGEDGLIWSERKGGASTCEAHIRDLVARIDGITGGGLPNVTITSRCDVELNEPLTRCSYSELLDAQPGVGLSILLPIRIPPGPESSPLEMWTLISRTSHGLSGRPILSGGVRRFVQRLVGDQILSQFHAGETRHDFAQETFKAFASQTVLRNEVWIRPGWEAAALLPEKFQQPPARPPVLSKEQLAKKKDDDIWKKKKAQVKSQWESRGYKWNAQRQSWGPKG
jgi:hypothetical protein